MPLYEYQCQTCGRRTEKIQKFSDPELTTCPHCSGKLERTLTAPAVHFAGSGWYKDLYSSPKPAAPATSGESSSAPASDAAKSDAAKPSTPAASTPAPAAPAPSTPGTKS